MTTNPERGGVRFHCWAVVRPAEELEGVWMSHCLDFDVVSQGSSPQDAIDMLVDAIAMVVADDLDHGRNPLDRRSPEEFWRELESLQDRGEKVEDLDCFLKQEASRPFTLAFPFVLLTGALEHQVRTVQKQRRIPAFASLRETGVTAAQCG